MGRRKIHKQAMRSYHIQINILTQNTLQIFKLFRPDLKTNNDIVKYAYDMFFRDFYAGEIFAFEYSMLEPIDKDFSRRINYRYTYQEHRTLHKKLTDINNKFKININKAEMFRRILFYMFGKYGLYKYNARQPLVQEFNIENMEEFIAELDPEIQAEIKKALAQEMYEELADDKTLQAENIDDKTLEIENIDDKTLEQESVDDTTIYTEIYEDYDLYNWEE